MSKITELPNELIYDIVMRGDISEIENFCLSNKRFNAVCEDRYRKEVEKTLNGKSNMEIYNKLNHVFVIYTDHERQENHEFYDFKKALQKFENILKNHKNNNKYTYDTSITRTKKSYSVNMHHYLDDGCHEDLTVTVVGNINKKLLENITTRFW